MIEFWPTKHDRSQGRRCGYCWQSRHEVDSGRPTRDARPGGRCCLRAHHMMVEVVSEQEEVCGGYGGGHRQLRHRWKERPVRRCCVEVQYVWRKCEWPWRCQPLWRKRGWHAFGRSPSTSSLRLGKGEERPRLWPTSSLEQVERRPGVGAEVVSWLGGGLARCSTWRRPSSSPAVGWRRVGRCSAPSPSSATPRRSSS